MESQRGIVVKSRETNFSGLENRGKIRTSCEPFVAFTGATGPRPSGWGGSQPGYIPNIDHNFS